MAKTQKQTDSRVKINLGCGVHLVAGWINVDAHLRLKDLRKGESTHKGLYKNAVVPDGVEFKRTDIRHLLFPGDWVDLIECDCVIEHLPYRDSLTAVKEMRRVLKPGGILRIQTTNFDAIAKLWQEYINRHPRKTNWTMDEWLELSAIIYGNQLHEGEYHKSAYNPRYLAHLLATAGFPSPINVRVFPTGCSERPPFESQAHRNGVLVARCETIFAEVRK